MKRHAMATCLLMAALGVCAQTQEQDSLRVINLQEVEVISTRATNSTPVAFTNIGKEQLKKTEFRTRPAVSVEYDTLRHYYQRRRCRGGLHHAESPWNRRHTHQRHRQRYSHQPTRRVTRYSGSTCRTSPPPSRTCRCNAEQVPQRTAQELSVPASTCRRVIFP